MDMLEIPSMGSLCPDGSGLPSPWDPEALMMKAVFSGSAGYGDSLEYEATMESSSTPSGTPLHSSSNALYFGAGWPMQALRSSDCTASESSVPSMVWDNTWGPGASSTSAQSSDSCLSDDQVQRHSEPAGAAAAAAARVVARSRAKRGHFLEVTQCDQQQVQVQAQPPSSSKRVKRATQKKQPAEPVGPTLSGLMRPFEAVKGYGMSVGSMTLQEINAKLKDSWKATASAAKCSLGTC